MKTVNSRFIAGAVCPGCRAMDRIVVETVDGRERRRCVDCDYRDEKSTGTGSEPRTRLRPPTEADASRRVRILDPGKLPESG